MRGEARALARELAKDLEDAAAVAEAAVDGLADGGSCNFDSVYLGVGRCCRIKRFAKPFDDLLGGGARVNTSLCHGYLSGVGTGHGQGARRTVAVEAAAHFLRDRGWQASVRYQVD